MTLDECKGFGWAKLLHRADRERTLARWRACVEEEGFWDHEHRIRGKNGLFFTILSRGIPIRDAAGVVRSWAGINLDISDRKRFITELRAAKEASEQASQAKDEFINVLSHELRTPLNPVLVAVQMLEHDQSLTADVRGWLSVIRRNVELEARLIDDLLDLTGILRGELVLHKEGRDVATLLKNVVDICRPEAQTKGLDIVTDLQATRTFAEVDPARLQQVFWNLLKNAIKFTQGGGRITLRTEDGPAGLRVVVEDTGIGIEPEALPRLFGPFVRPGGPPRVFAGLGVGLAICKALVEMHDGRIVARSNGRGQGASFLVELPGTMADHPAPPEAPATTRGPLRILLVDDHRDTCVLMKSMLARRGYLVMTAEDVQGALALARQHEFDLLVSDVGLPDGSGLDLMRALSAEKRIPGIALTGFGRDDDVRRSKEAGFDEHMTKPVSITKLEACIRRLCVTAMAAAGNVPSV
jgi:signal transduction histidine kinase/ActR/RegA family two-component response regulator